MTLAVGQLPPALRRPPTRRLRDPGHTGGAPFLTCLPSYRGLRSLVPSLPLCALGLGRHSDSRQRHPERGGRERVRTGYNWDDSRDYSKRRVRNQKRVARDCAGCAAQPTQPHGALSPPPAAARRTPVNASTVAPRATGWRSGPGTRLYPKERGDHGLSAAPPREGGFGTARHERHPPSARAHAVAAGASFSATGTGQRARWLEWRAALRGFAAEGLRGACVASSVCGGDARNSSMCSTFQLAMPISSIVFPSASFMNMFGGAPCVYVTFTFG